MNAPVEYRKLAAKEINDIKDSLEVIEKQLTPAELTEARKLASNWKAGQTLKRKK